MVTLNNGTYLTTRQAADALGLHVGTLAHQRSAGRSPIPYIRVAHAVLYRVADVEGLARSLGRMD